MAAPTNAANLKKALANDAPELTTSSKTEPLAAQI
jgi:hypothetical protein